MEFQPSTITNSILILDFDDSFTYNLYALLRNYFTKAQLSIIPKPKIKRTLEKLLRENKKVVLVLGPGPGHPSEYDDILEDLDLILHKKNIFVYGICLGHQIIWKEQGAMVSRSVNPIHGQVEVLELNMVLKSLLGNIKEVSLQRYNSLSIKLDENTTKITNSKKWKILAKNNEILISFDDNFFSMQYHPESIGTNSPEIFLKPILNFFSNGAL